MAASSVATLGHSACLRCCVSLLRFPQVYRDLSHRSPVLVRELWIAQVQMGVGMVGAGHSTRLIGSSIALCVALLGTPGGALMTRTVGAAGVTTMPAAPGMTTAHAKLTRPMANALLDGMPLTFAASGRGPSLFSARGANYTLSLTPRDAVMFLGGALRHGATASAGAAHHLRGASPARGPA